MPLGDILAVLVPVCKDLKERHDRGEKLFVHPSAIAAGVDGEMHFHPELAVAPSNPRDRAALAPELVRSNAPGDARASVFAIGAMFYEAITGSAVGPGMRRPRDVNPSLPESVEILINTALAETSRRPEDLGALASAMHHVAATVSNAPEEVDVVFSILPSAPLNAGTSSPALTNNVAAAPALRDPAMQLATLKARLEKDTRPHYVVIKDRMDHGPFTAVEVLQQIASHAFAGGHGLRDELTGVSQTIDEWEEFAPFAEHARMHRQIAQEKKAVAQVEIAEKKAGLAKFAVGGVLAIVLLAAGGMFIAKKVGERKDGGDLAGDPSAIDLSTGGSLKGNKKVAVNRGAGGVTGGGGGYVGGGSYEAALASNNQEIAIGVAGAPDLTEAQLKAPMQNVTFVSGCGASAGTAVTVKVAVKNGRAVGVSVYTNPSNPTVAGCIDRQVRGLSWPSNPKMDFLTTTYSAQ